MTALMERTPLYEQHVQAGANMVDFHGWEMPIRYGQIPAEHQKVRLSAGLFDLCHMGRLEFIGKDAEKWVQSVVTQDLATMKVGDARYSLVCNDEGGILDDVIVYKLPHSTLLVVNASNREKIVSWFEAHRPSDCDATLVDRSREWGMIAVQGPQTVRILSELVKLPEFSNWDHFDYYHVARGLALGKEILVARTGYTGEDGVELYAPTELTASLWNAVLESGGPRVAPVGLGARDTLRCEAGMPLYGNELSEQTNPYEAKLGFAVKLEKPVPFVGQGALKAIKAAGVARRLVGFRVDSRRVARGGMTLFRGEEQVGVITSGIPSPTLGFPIALGYLDSKVTEPDGLWVDIRGIRSRVNPEPLPFFSRTRRRGDRAL